MCLALGLHPAAEAEPNIFLIEFLMEETSLTLRAKIHDFATAQADEEARAKMAAGMQMQQDCWVGWP